MSIKTFNNVTLIICWGLAINGKFTTKAAYNQLVKWIHSGRSTNPNWDWIWKLKIPQKLMYFLWLVQSDKILSNNLRAIRNIINDALPPPS